MGAGILRAIWLGLLLLTVALVPGSALAARYALVIGINDYVNVPRLEKAIGDAEAMTARLRSLGFTVTPVLNPDRRTLNQAIATFSRQVKPGDDVLVHFSGHGVELEGNNLLLPADVPLPDSSDKDFLIGEAISLTDLMQRISDTHAAVKVFVIDACRDNPFATRGRSIGTNRGLSVTEAMEGAFVFYSAGRGQTALDSLGDNDPSTTSVYTRVLINALGQPGLSLTDIAKSVRKQVATLADGVNHEQQPAYYDELNDDGFFFSAGARAGGQAAQPEPTVRPPASDTTREEFVFAQGVDTVEGWTIFLSYHPTGYYADMARAARSKAEVREAKIEEPVVTPPSREQSTGRSLATYQDLDFYGADISKNRVADVAECASNCLNNNQCVAFTFNANPKLTKGPNCLLKDSIGEPQPYQFAFSAVFFDSGDAPPIMHGFAIDPDNDVLADTDITGYDMFLYPVSGANTVAKCRQECLEEGRCKAFSFAEKVKQCWLKDVAGPQTYRAHITTGIKSAITQQSSATYPITP
jgi:hypothetical protein